jgi:hypothetical protein
MFNLLIFIGFALIIWGLYMDKAPQEFSDFKDLNYRIELIENLLYNNEPIFEDEYHVHEEEVATFKTVMDDTNTQTINKEIDLPSNILEASEVISQYEEGKYTIEEVCSILNMKKGEVLLLKNLYKKYQD